ncbi:hypothetical protein PMAYCL1PPCAC_15049, partial [Pristionchus mayeri]
EEYTGNYPVGVIFHCAAFAAGISFLISIHFFLVNPTLLNRMLNIANRGCFKEATKFIVKPASHTAEPVSTFFLRIGTLIFGCAGVILYGLELFLIIM